MMSRNTSFDRLARSLASAAIVTCAGTLALTILVVAMPSLQAVLPLPDGMGPGYVTGEQIDLPSVLIALDGPTLVIIGRSTCAASRRSAPAHAAVIAAANRLSVRTLLVVPSGDDASTYAGELGVAASDVFHADVSSLDVRRVPTTAVVDAGGTIRFVHEDAPTGTETQRFVSDTIAALEMSRSLR